MAIIKVIEVLAQSSKSWEDAARQALDEASKSIRNIKSLYVQEMQAVRNNGEIQFRIDAKISFVVDEKEQGEEQKGQKKEKAEAAMAANKPAARTGT